MNMTVRFIQWSNGDRGLSDIKKVRELLEEGETKKCKP